MTCHHRPSRLLLLLLLVVLPALAPAGLFRRAFQAARDTAGGSQQQLQQPNDGDKQQQSTGAINPLPPDLFPYGPMVQAQQQAQEAREQEQSPYSPTPPPQLPPLAAAVVPKSDPPSPPAPDPAPPMDRAPAVVQQQQQQQQQQPPPPPPIQPSPTSQPQPPPVAPASATGINQPTPFTAVPSPATMEAPAATPAVMTKEDLYLKDAEMGGFYFDEPEEPTPGAPPGATSPADMALPVDAVAAKGVGPIGRRDLAEQAEEANEVEEERSNDPFAAGDAVVELMRGGGDSAALALKSVRAAAQSLARQGIAAAERKAGVGAGAIASPAVLAVPHPVLGVTRAVFVGFKRIGAMNVDFNLPISAYDRFGTSCAVLLPQGDLDHDPTSVEVAVGAPGDHTYQKKQGAVYIIFLANFGACFFWVFALLAFIG
jgi:hypothetical protein